MCNQLREMCTKYVNIFYENKSRLPTMKEVLKIFFKLAPNDEVKKVFGEYMPLIYKIEMCGRMANGEITEFPKSPPKQPQQEPPSATLEDYLHSQIILNNVPAPITENAIDKT